MVPLAHPLLLQGCRGPGGSKGDLGAKGDKVPCTQGCGGSSSSCCPFWCSNVLFPRQWMSLCGCPGAQGHLLWRTVRAAAPDPSFPAPSCFGCLKMLYCPRDALRAGLWSVHPEQPPAKIGGYREVGQQAKGSSGAPVHGWGSPRHQLPLLFAAHARWAPVSPTGTFCILFLRVPAEHRELKDPLGFGARSAHRAFPAPAVQQDPGDQR